LRVVDKTLAKYTLNLYISTTLVWCWSNANIPNSDPSTIVLYHIFKQCFTNVHGVIASIDVKYKTYLKYTLYNQTHIRSCAFCWLI